MKDKKDAHLKLILFSALSALTVTAAVVAPVLQHRLARPAINNDFSNTQVGNRNRILNFINDAKKINQSLLSGQLSVDEIAHPYADRSFVTVAEAQQQGWFDFNLHSAFKLNLYLDDLGAELAYIKANITNSTYPVVGLRIFAGQDETYSEIIYEYSESGLSGFKQTSEELSINKIVNAIENTPQAFFELKKDIGKFGDPGLYAKNVKLEDFELIDNDKIKILKANDYFLELTNVEVNKVIPSELELTYNVIFDNGLTQFKKTYNKVTITNFDIEYGVDDPESKVKNFIKENEKTYLADLYQYFEYDPPKPDEDNPASLETSTKPTMATAYQNNWIKFNSKSENLYTITNAGLFLEFKPYSDSNKNDVFPSPFDSSTPMYRLYLTSYKDTPLQYTQPVVIEGTKQEGAFQASNVQNEMEALDALLDELNVNVDDFLQLESITLEGPLANAEPPKPPVPFGSSATAKTIPFDILKTAYDKYKEDGDKYSQPFNFKIKLDESKLTEIKDEAKKDKLKTTLKKVVEATNKLTIADKLEAIENNDQDNFQQFKVNIALGTKESDLFISTDNYALIRVDEQLFTGADQYYGTQVKKVVDFIKDQKNKQFIKINLVSDDDQILSQANAVALMRQGQWKKVFSSVTLLNLKDVITYPDFDTPVKVAINFDKLGVLTDEQIAQIIEKQQIAFAFLVSKNGQEQEISWDGSDKILFRFDELFA